ncbi:hypothetical protein RugamoR64_00370 [Duganella rhizosphaerae]
MAGNLGFMLMWAVFGLAASGSEHKTMTLGIMLAALSGIAISLTVSIRYMRRQRKLMGVLSIFLMTPVAFLFLMVFGLFNKAA